MTPYILIKTLEVVMIRASILRILSLKSHYHFHYQYINTGIFKAPRKLIASSSIGYGVIDNVEMDWERLRTELFESSNPVSSRTSIDSSSKSTSKSKIKILNSSTNP